MITTADEIQTVEELRRLVHRTLCEKENLLADQFRMSEMQLLRRGRPCGLQFSLQGPRNVRLGAIWAADHNLLYFYDAAGERFLKLRLRKRILDAAPAA